MSFVAALVTTVRPIANDTSNIGLPIAESASKENRIVPDAAVLS